MDERQLIRLCKMYAKEGWSVQGQLDRFLDGDNMEELNPNALKMIQQFFEQAEKYGVEGAGDQVEYIKEYLDN